jgi:hypothetical protein
MVTNADAQVLHEDGHDVRLPGREVDYRLSGLISVLFLLQLSAPVLLG